MYFFHLLFLFNTVDIYPYYSFIFTHIIHFHWINKAQFIHFSVDRNLGVSKLGGYRDTAIKLYICNFLCKYISEIFYRSRLVGSWSRCTFMFQEIVLQSSCTSLYSHLRLMRGSRTQHLYQPLVLSNFHIFINSVVEYGVLFFSFSWLLIRGSMFFMFVSHPSRISFL